MPELTCLHGQPEMFHPLAAGQDPVSLKLTEVEVDRWQATLKYEDGRVFAMTLVADGMWAALCQTNEILKNRPPDPHPDAPADRS